MIMGEGADAFWHGEAWGGMGLRVCLVSWRACSGKRLVLWAAKREQNSLDVGGNMGCWQEMLMAARSTLLRVLDFVPGLWGGCCGSFSVGGGWGHMCLLGSLPCSCGETGWERVLKEAERPGRRDC